MMQRARTTAAVLLLTLVGCSDGGGTEPEPYDGTIEDLAYGLGADVLFPQATDLDDGGRVVGWTIDDGAHAATFESGRVTRLPRLVPGQHHRAQAVSPNGRHIGGEVGDVPVQVVRWTDGAAPVPYAKLPGVAICRVHAVNDAGQAAGHCAYQAVFWEADGSVTDLGTLDPAGPTVAYGINASGTVVGGSAFSERGVAFRWTRATGMRALPTPSLGPGVAVSASAYDINDDGQIVGTVIDATSAPGARVRVERPVLWPAAEGAPPVVPSFSARSVSAYAINARGLIAGVFQKTAADTARPFVWDAVNGLSLMRMPGNCTGTEPHVRLNASGQVVPRLTCNWSPVLRWSTGR